MGSLHAPLPGSTSALLMGSYTENKFGSNSNKKIQRNMLLKVCTAPSFPKRSTTWSRLVIAHSDWGRAGDSPIWHLGRVLPLLQEIDAVSLVRISLTLLDTHVCMAKAEVVR